MSDQTFIQIRNYYDRTIDIDDAEGNVATLPIRVRRFTIEQLRDYSIERTQALEKPHERLIFRKQDGDEQETRDIVIGKNTFPVHVIPDEEVRRRRLAEMTPEQLETYRALETKSEWMIAAFFDATIRAHIWVPPHVRLLMDAEHGDPRELKTGDDLLAAFGGNTETLKALGNAIYEENTMSAEEKKRSRSLFALRPSSSEPIPTADGGAPDATAENAGNTATAPSGDVTAPLETTPSGLIAT